MKHSESTEMIAPAWVAALNQLDDIARSETANAGTYSYRYATLAQAAQQARDVLGQHDLAVHQSAHGDSLGAISVTSRVWHTSGEWIESEPLVMPAKGGPQDVGSAISYARRYALMAFLGLATDDDDGAGAQKAAEEANKPHPLSDRVSTVQGEMRRFTDTQKDEIRKWADGRKLTPNAMLTDEAWLELVESWIDEHTGGEK